MIFAGKNEIEAKENARKASIDNKGKYITLNACFGIYMQISKRFNVHDPSDSLYGAYWLNGKEKACTDAQIIRDEQARQAYINIKSSYYLRAFITFNGWV